MVCCRCVNVSICIQDDVLLPPTHQTAPSKLEVWTASSLLPPDAYTHTHIHTHIYTHMHAHTHTHAHMHAHAHKMIKTCKKMVCMEHVLSASLGFTVHFQFLALCNSAQRGGMLYALSKSTYTQTNTDQCTQTHHICVLHICICQVTVYLCVIAESVLPVTAPTG